MIDYIFNIGDEIEFMMFYDSASNIIRDHIIIDINQDGMFVKNYSNDQWRYPLKPLDMIFFEKSERYNGFSLITHEIYGVVISIEIGKLHVRCSKSIKKVKQFSEQYSDLL